MTAETGVAPTGGEVPDFAGGDFRTLFDQGAKRAVAAFSADGVMDKSMKLPFGDLPGGAFVFIAAIDTFTHGWDLAKATGQATDLDPTLGAQLLEAARAALPDELRGPDGQAPFGPQVEVAKASCPADELAGFMGRQP